MNDLYTVLDVDPDGTPDGQHVEIDTSLDDAKRRRDELQAMAVDDREAADFRVYQLVEPGGVGCTRQDRHDGLVQAVVYHAEVGVDEDEHVVRTAAEMAAFLADGTVPTAEGPDFGIVVDRQDDLIRVIVQGRVIAELDHDQAGNAGIDQLEAAVLGVLAACGVEPEYVGPGEQA